MTRIIVTCEKSDDGIVVEKQLPISDRDKIRLIGIRREIFNSDVEKLSESMYSGEISLGQWEESMKKLIREMHASTTAIAKGGWDNMTSADWGRIGTPLREQYKYLHQFSVDISNNRDTISLAAIQARSRLYGLASSGTAAIVQAGPDIEKQLPWIPRDGSTECLVGCKCYWKFRTVSKDPKSKQKIVSAVWKLSPAEHCKTCLERRNFEVIMTLPIDYDVPDFIGGY